MKATYDTPEDVLTLIFDEYEKIFNYPYDDWITLSYDRRTGNLAEIKIEGMSRIQDKGYHPFMQVYHQGKLLSDNIGPIT